MSEKGFSREWLAKNHPEAFKELIRDKTPPKAQSIGTGDVVKPNDKKPAKYRNVKTEVDGINFDSKKEANRYCQLSLLQKSGEISDLKLQVPFPLICDTLIVNNIPIKLPYKLIKEYIADFTYTKNNIFICEDVKGWVKTKEYKLKKRLMKILYNVQITEV